MKVKFLTLCILGVSFSALSQSRYPLEFADFFTENDEVVELTIAGEQSSIDVRSLVTYEGYKLHPESGNVKNLRDYLSRNKVSNETIDAVIEELIAGVAAMPECASLVAGNCIPVDHPNQAEYSFDFDSRQVKLFLSSDLLISNLERRYHEAINAQPATILTTDMYVNANRSSSNTIISNYLTAGLPYGYLSAETQYNTAEGEFEVYETLYDVEFGGQRALIGYQEETQKEFNTTDYLNSGSDYTGISLSLGSSQNLLIGGKDAVQQIYYFAPVSGQLAVYQGERLLFSRYVQQGQNAIGYEELPRGAYNIRITITQGEQEVFNETRQVINNQRFNLGVDSWDYRLQLGWLDDIDVNSTLDEFDGEDRPYYGRAAASYRYNENVILSSALTSNLDDTQLQLGTDFVVNSQINGQYVAGVHSSGDSQHYAILNIAPFYASYEIVDALGSNSALTHYLYDTNDKKEFSLGVSNSLFGGHGFINYFSTEETSDQFVAESDTVSAGWTYSVLGGNLSLSTSYIMPEDGEESWSSSVNWSIDLDDHLTASSHFYFDKDGFTSNRNTLTYRQQGENWNGGVTAGARLESNDISSELSANANGHTDYFGYNAYGYMTGKGQRTFNGSVTTTQIITKDGIDSTHRRAASYIKIVPTSNGAAESDEPVDISYDVMKNDRYVTRNSIKLGEEKVLPIDIYNDVQVNLDADKYNAEIEYDNSTSFILPGSLLSLTGDVEFLKSQIFIFNDISGQPVVNVRCIGNGCKDVEKLSDDGVYRVNYKDIDSFKLISDRRLCVYDASLVGNNFINAYCLPNLDEVEGIDELVDSNENEYDVVYIGRYESTDNATTIIEQLTNVGLSTKVVNVGETIYLYINNSTQYTTAQSNLLESLEAYAIYDSINYEDLFGAK